MKISLVFVMVLVLRYASVPAQVLSVYETAREEDQRVDLQHGIVDINATLKISLNTDELLPALGKNLGGSKALAERLGRLNFILENQIAILDVLQKSIKAAGETQAIGNLGQYAVLMTEFYERLEKDEELRKRVNDLFDEHRAMRATLDREAYPTGQVYVLKHLATDQEDILDVLRNSDEVRRVRTQVIATLNTRDEYGRRVHIENFDQYAAGEFYEVERWVTTFSGEDLRAFERSRALASQLNTMVDRNFRELEDLIRSNLRSIDCFDTLLSSYDKNLDNVEAVFESDTETVRAFLSQAQGELVAVYELLAKLRDIDPENLLADFNSLQQRFLTAVDSVPHNIAALAGRLPESLKSAKILEDLVRQTNDCISLLEKDAESVARVYFLAENLLSPLKRSAGDATDIGEEVFSFTIDKIPAAGFIDLRTTGKRQNGDELVLKLVTHAKSDSVERAPGIVLERHALTLQQISAYVVPQVTVIMANPYIRNDAVAIERNFQFAPSASLLLKAGSRTAGLWNFLSPGIGFNMSAPDFDLDSTPDIAVGGVITLFRDIASIGWSYNTSTDSPLWFFGLSLPFANLGFPAGSLQREE